MLILTSDLPSTPDPAVFELLRVRGDHTRIAWIAPITAAAVQHFPKARAAFAAQGLVELQPVDIDAQPDLAILDELTRFDVIYLSGGDPVRFLHNLRRLGLSERLRGYWQQGGVLVGASGGSLQFTPNVSLFRLTQRSLATVLTEREQYRALSFVDYELLPHWNRSEPAFLETVRCYSEQVPHDIVALSDGSALVHEDTGCRRIGTCGVYRSGVWLSDQSIANPSRPRP